MVITFKTIQLIRNNPRINKVLSKSVQLAMALLIIAISSIFGSCGGYTTFSSNIKELDFSFKYPREWGIDIIEKYTELAYVNISAPSSENESPLKVMITCFYILESKAEQEANRIISGRIYTESKQKNFNLLRDETIVLDGVEGHLIECTFEFDMQSIQVFYDEPRYLPTRLVDMAFPRNDKVYEILISASQNEWNVWEQDIQNVLDTFKWR